MSYPERLPKAQKTLTGTGPLGFGAQEFEAITLQSWRKRTNFCDFSRGQIGLVFDMSEMSALPGIGHVRVAILVTVGGAEQTSVLFKMSKVSTITGMGHVGLTILVFVFGASTCRKCRLHGCFQYEPVLCPVVNRHQQMPLLNKSLIPQWFANWMGPASPQLPHCFLMSPYHVQE